MPPQSQAAPAATTLPSPGFVGQSNTISVQDILFGVLTIVLAIASVLLAYLQLVHMRNQARSPRPATEMFSIHGPSRQDSGQSSDSTSDDTVVEVEAPQEPRPIPHIVGKSSNAALETEVDVGIPSRKTAPVRAVTERIDYGSLPAHNTNDNAATKSLDVHFETDATHSTTTRQILTLTTPEAPSTRDDAAP